MINPAGNPNTSGGNNPAVVAAMGNIRQGAMGNTPQAAAPPNQGQAPMDANTFGAQLAGILQAYVASGGAQEFTEQLRQFFEAFVRIAAEMKAGVEGQAAMPGAAPPVIPQGTAQATPQPPMGAVPPAGM
jgi:hypothetical protein